VEAVPDRKVRGRGGIIIVAGPSCQRNHSREQGKTKVVNQTKVDERQ